MAPMTMYHCFFPLLVIEVWMRRQVEYPDVLHDGRFEDLVVFDIEAEVVDPVPDVLSNVVIFGCEDEVGCRQRRALRLGRPSPGVG